MRFHAKSVLFCLLLCLAAVPAVAEEESQKAIRSRPLTSGEGLAIVSAALDSRYHARFLADCSHFVLGLYERAGFPYRYANSSELYAGIDEFRQVANPQTGDLVVWRGHTGIVINPAEHSFFSRLRSGPGVNSYDSAYWKKRGRPRFFRYLKVVPSGVLSSSIRTVSTREPTTDDAVVDAPDEPSNDTASTARPANGQPVNFSTPRVTVVNAVRPKPDQVGAAFLQTCADSEASLRGRDFFKSVQSLIVFDRFKVRKVHIAGNQDWVDVEIDELVSLTGNKAEVHKRSERQRWLLSRRDNTSWELTPSRDTIYLPQPIAVRILAHELAQLTEDRSEPAGRTEEKAELARILDVLLEK
jgi:hypothetical protein